MHQVARKDKKTGWRTWLLLPFAPLFVILALPVLLIFGAVYVVAEVTSRIRMVRLWRTMRASKRTISWAELEAELVRGPGTLLIDMSVIGWNDSDVWWIGESIGAAAMKAGVPISAMPSEPESDEQWEARLKEPVFERWCLRTFIDQPDGKAKLVQSRRSARAGRRALAKAESLRARYPMLEVVQVATWMARHADGVAPAARARE